MNVNEKRFLTVPEAMSSTRVKHKRNYSFSKQLDRSSKSVFKLSEHVPDSGYSPNFEANMKSLGSVGPTFDKLQAHKSLERKLVGMF